MAHYLYGPGKSTKYNTGAPGTGGAAGEGRKRRRFLCPGPACQGGTWARGRGSDCPAARSRAQPHRLLPGPARGCGRARGLLELGGPFLSATTPQPPARLGARGAPPGRGGDARRRCALVVHTRGGDCGDLGAILLPGLQILQSKERRVVQTERVGLDRVVEGLFWKASCCSLQHQAGSPAAAPPPLLRRLPPAPGRRGCVPSGARHRGAAGGALTRPGAEASREPRARSPSASRPALCARHLRVRGWVGSLVFVRREIAGRGTPAGLPTCTPGYCGFANNKDCFFAG